MCYDTLYTYKCGHEILVYGTSYCHYFQQRLNEINNDPWDDNNLLDAREMRCSDPVPNNREEVCGNCTQSIQSMRQQQWKYTGVNSRHGRL